MSSFTTTGSGGNVNGVVVKGDKELIRTMSALDSRVKRRIARAAVQKASTPIAKDARRNMPKDTGTTRKAVGRKIKTYGKDGTVVAIIGVRRGKSAIVDGRKIDPHNIIHLIEEGFTHVGGTSVEGKHPIRRAWESNRHKSARIIKETVWERIKIEARKAHR